MNEDEWDGRDRRRAPSGFSLDSWSSLQSLITIALVMLSGIAWGLKLEAKIEDCRSKIEDKTESIRAEIANMRATIDKGVLPVTAIRLEQIERDIRKIEEHQK